ncbi:MAG: hypothetical protein AAGD86_04070 [Pseudomonadota bacterium]
MNVQAATISLHGNAFAVVLVPMELVNAPGEADMAIDALKPRFGGAPVVLMAQRDDGTPRYYGDEHLVHSLEGVPVDEMPWKDYPG